MHVFEYIQIYASPKIFITASSQWGEGRDLKFSIHKPIPKGDMCRDMPAGDSCADDKTVMFQIATAVNTQIKGFIIHYTRH